MTDIDNDDDDQSIGIPFDILDYIFSFLKSHPKALLACSKAHPVLSQIVERYRFHHIIIDTEGTDISYAFRPSDLRRHIIETPRIVKYVAVLQIELRGTRYADWVTAYLEEIASLLPMFPVLQCFMLPTREFWPPSWEKFPWSFTTAVANCLHLPTLQEIHIGASSFPLSILDNHANINHLSLFGLPENEHGHPETTYPQIKYLALEGQNHKYHSFIHDWVKRHTIAGLRSLTYDFSSSSEAFNVCSETLEDLYLCLHRRGPCYPYSRFRLDLSTFPHLRHLTLRVEIFIPDTDFHQPHLPIAVQILKTASSLQRLSIELCFASDVGNRNLDAIDLSPLKVLADPSFHFPPVDLYMYSPSSSLRITHTLTVSLLAKHEVLTDLIERGMLVVHLEAAPALSRSFIDD